MMKFMIVFILIFSSLFANRTDDILEIYFDTPELHLLDNNLSLKYQALKYTSKKKNKIKYHENIVYIDKLQKKHIFKVKHYNRVKFVEEKHPLISLIKRNDRRVFIELLKKDGVKYPLKLKYIFELSRDSQKKIDEQGYYKMLFKKKDSEDKFFRVKFKYPYFINLFFATFFSFIGFCVILLINSKILNKGNNR